jgi:curli production assembly/transport component CsgF
MIPFPRIAAKAGLRVYAMRRFLGIVVLAMSVATAAGAGQLTYQPVNPTFGGNPLNGSYLLGIANANNQHLNNPETQTTINTTQSTAQELQQALVSALISQATSTAIGSILGTNGQTPLNSGTFSIAGETINFNRVGGQINVTLIDPNGSQTQISVPVPQF